MLKQYVFIPKNMKTGKACSQVAHATFLAINNEARTYGHKCKGMKEEEIPKYIVEEWMHSGMCVIVLEVESWHRLRDVEKY